MKLPYYQFIRLSNATSPLKKKWYLDSNILLSVVPSILGLVLSVVAIVQAQQISEQQTKIDGFDSLLTNQNRLNVETDTLIRKMTTQLSISSTTNEIVRDQLQKLEDQLVLSTDAQSKANVKAEFERLSSRNSLFVTTMTIDNIRLEEIDNSIISNYIDQVKPMLERELHNPYLLADTAMFKYWMYAYKALTASQRIRKSKNIVVVNANGQDRSVEAIDKVVRDEFIEAYRAIGDATFFIHRIMIKDGEDMMYSYKPPKRIFPTPKL